VLYRCCETQQFAHLNIGELLVQAKVLKVRISGIFLNMEMAYGCTCHLNEPRGTSVRIRCCLLPCASISRGPVRTHASCFLRTLQSFLQVALTAFRSSKDRNVSTCCSTRSGSARRGKGSSSCIMRSLSSETKKRLPNTRRRYSNSCSYDEACTRRKHYVFKPQGSSIL
jgi:hypothetical protein